MQSCRLIVFVRAPRKGTVKTRLAAGIGPEAACAAYRQLVGLALGRICETNFQVQLRFTPDDAAEEVLPWIRAGWKPAPQGAGDLGERILRAIQDSVTDGFSGTLVVGTDCPYFTASDLTEARDALDSNDIVIGPATDGGYWLIGMRKPHECLFEGIPWSTSDVLETTRQKATKARLKVHSLRTLSDIDTPEDWRRFVEQMPIVRQA